MTDTQKIPSSTLFAQRLRACRLQCGLSQMRLGVLAGIDERSASPRINQYERGKHFPDFGTIVRLAAVLGVPAAYFFAEDEQLADWILCWGKLNASDKSFWLEKVKEDLSMVFQV
ncbi:hypothetical protein BXU06_07005 [Aquaspirillum sp. LM1]|jgi:transcriptional regulator with XRE-family HTH domain|uniref:helix-turn-helix domain-containing protein n=1 Tax=Aquaspirillum sp. LM1 TaxID=1938604 RepID=UPI000983997C|nr:helix-turn-helix transcriptional regulator [Aquaspirillum sp. LM1]AQR64841.1 hypothetical protein BXU06_07005 [Aquaspirillum sp. LM1]